MPFVALLERWVLMVFGSPLPKIALFKTITWPVFLLLLLLSAALLDIDCEKKLLDEAAFELRWFLPDDDSTFCLPKEKA